MHHWNKPWLNWSVIQVSQNHLHEWRNINQYRLHRPVVNNKERMKGIHEGRKEEWKEKDGREEKKTGSKKGRKEAKKVGRKEGRKGRMKEARKWGKKIRRQKERKERNNLSDCNSYLHLYLYITCDFMVLLHDILLWLMLVS